MALPPERVFAHTRFGPARGAKTFRDLVALAAAVGPQGHARVGAQELRPWDLRRQLCREGSLAAAPECVLRNQSSLFVELESVDLGLAGSD